MAEVQQPVAGEHQQRQPEAERQPDVLQLIGSHERSDESGSDSSGEESDVPSPAQDSVVRIVWDVLKRKILKVSKN